MTVSTSATVLGGAIGRLSAEQVREFVARELATAGLDGQRVALIVPDATRTCPLPLLLDAVHRVLAGRVGALTAVIALGTHAPMSEAELARWLGYPPGELAGRYPGLQVINHEWAEPATYADLGTISAERVAELSAGRLHTPVHVRLNRAVIDYDVALVVGPVFPHEVVGFSGGNKYFVPGVAGPEIIDVSHWLGALVTSAEIIGVRGPTPVRELIDAAAALIPARRLALCVVTDHDAVRAITFGAPEPAWAAAADIAAQTHVRYLDKPVERVLSIIPDRYRDIWTAAKGFYKVEPVVADGGEVIIYAPHITEFAPMHPEIVDVGYHCRDYFLAHWGRYRDRHWGVLAHSTHLFGAGSWDAATGEHQRVRVTLATGIPEAVVRRANLGYRDPATVDPAAAAGGPGTFVVPDAGEVLFRLRAPLRSAE